MTRRIRLLEEDYEQTSVRLTTASGKLEEASKFAEESERYTSPITGLVLCCLQGGPIKSKSLIFSHYCI